MERLKSGDIQIDDTDYPAFMYEKDIIYDPDEPEVGLFRGYLLVRVCFFLCPLSFNDNILNRFSDMFTLAVPLFLMVSQSQMGRNPARPNCMDLLK